MKRIHWDIELSPPSGGIQRLKNKIAERETDKRHFRMMLATLIFALFYLIKPNPWVNQETPVSEAQTQLVRSLEKQWKDSLTPTPLYILKETPTMVHYLALIKPEH